MTIFKPSGEVYKPSGSLAQTQPGNTPSQELFNNYDIELINLGGSPIFYYEYIPSPSSFDPLYVESRNKIYSQFPIELKAIYDPIPSQMLQTTFGIDSPDSITFQLNYRSVVSALGHLPIIGSRIYTPHLGENWEIKTRHLGEFFKYKVYRLTLECIRFQETLTTNEGKVTKDTESNPKFEID